MKVGDRVQTITGRHGEIRAIGSARGRVVAKVRIEGDTDADGDMEIPLGALVPSPKASEKGSCLHCGGTEGRHAVTCLAGPLAGSAER